MQRSLEQRYAIKFCVKLGKSATETFDMIKQAYPDVDLARSSVFPWHQAFLEGREEVADEHRAGRPSTSTNTGSVTRVREVLNSVRRLSIHLIAQMLNLPKSVVHDIVTEHLNMRKVCAKMFLKVLTDDQKWRRVEVCQENLNV
ncbi:protein GVQW3-like [Parasteatoda tepidariorum]|uniref:protein GVQW3-like n=1 Tax=Parasteatoda tepidariorum TaxID=114398 RepID=UPI00077F94ED|nr:protein GVQW3-like [Parasteatoda tepidariorum]